MPYQLKKKLKELRLENKNKLLNDTDIYLLDNKVNINNVKFICLFGQSEIDQETTIGSLLRIKK